MIHYVRAYWFIKAISSSLSTCCFVMNTSKSQQYLFRVDVKIVIDLFLLFFLIWTVPTRFCRKAFTAVHKTWWLSCLAQEHTRSLKETCQRGKKKITKDGFKKKTKKTGKWQVEQVSCHLCSRRKDLGVVIHVTCASLCLTPFHSLIFF